MNRLCQRSALVFGLFVSLAGARAQLPFSNQKTVDSVSGQFVVSTVGDDARPFTNLNPAGDTNIIQLKPALLAVSAERFKVSLREQLGIRPDADWSGKIFLLVHPARSLDETETIASSPFLNHWNYHVGLPDTLSKMRYARMMSGVLLLEIADRNAPPGGHSAEVPAWLVDGLAQQVLAVDGEKILLAVPRKKGDELPASRIAQSERGFDPLADARKILQNTTALTFDQLSWPTDGQMTGADGGVYYASAQVFVSELMGLKNGREKMRVMVAELPDYLNWQLAFFRAFAGDFKNARDVEKWWALRVVNFAAHGPGPRWTTEVSLNRFQELLSVPVEFRAQSNSLPSHADVSLQVALQNLDYDQRDDVIRTKVRDLALSELRFAPPFGELADAYRLVLIDYLGEAKNVTRPSAASKHGMPVPHPTGVADTVKRLNELDVRRRDAEARATLNLQANSQGGNQPGN